MESNSVNLPEQQYLEENLLHQLIEESYTNFNVLVITSIKLQKFVISIKQLTK